MDDSEKAQDASIERVIDSLQSRAELGRRSVSGWTIIADVANQAVWIIPPEDHATYPSFIKRFVVPADGKYRIDNLVACNKAIATCQTLLRDAGKLMP